MIRGDAHNADTHPQLRSELLQYHLQAEGQPGEFQQSEAEQRQHLERLDTEGAQFRSLFEETRTENAGKCTRSQSLTSWRRNNSSPTSQRFNRDTELQGQLQNLRHWTARINARMHRIQMTKNSMNTRNNETKQLQLICDIRWEEVNLPIIKT